MIPSIARKMAVYSFIQINLRVRAADSSISIVEKVLMTADFSMMEFIYHRIQSTHNNLKSLISYTILMGIDTFVKRIAVCCIDAARLHSPLMLLPKGNGNTLFLITHSKPFS